MMIVLILRSRQVRAETAKRAASVIEAQQLAGQLFQALGTCGKLSKRARAIRQLTEILGTSGLIGHWSYFSLKNAEGKSHFPFHNRGDEQFGSAKVSVLQLHVSRMPSNLCWTLAWTGVDNAEGD